MAKILFNLLNKNKINTLKKLLILTFSTFIGHVYYFVPLSLAIVALFTFPGN